MITDPTVREALAIHEAFLRIGYSPEEIFVKIGKMLVVVLRSCGRDFSVSAGLCEISLDEWQAAVEEWNKSTALRKEIYEQSGIFANGAKFLMALRAAGFGLGRALEATVH